MEFTDDQMREFGYTAWRVLPDETILAVCPMAYGNGRLNVGINLYGFEDCYCYDSVDKAIASMIEFDPEKMKEPEGWKRHPFTGRRRPGGDATKEFVNL